MKNNISIVIAEDTEIYMDGLIYNLQKIPYITIVGQATNGTELITLVAEKNPDLVLTDVMMPQMGGIEACQIIVSRYAARVIAMTIFEETSSIIDMINAGASSFVMKNAPKEELEKAIELTWRGQQYYCNRTNRRMMEHHAKMRAREKMPSFTARELEILGLICKGLSHEEIATKLYLSKTTIHIASHRLLQKTGQQNAIGLYNYAIEHGLYKPKI